MRDYGIITKATITVGGSFSSQKGRNNLKRGDCVEQTTLQLLLILLLVLAVKKK